MKQSFLQLMLPPAIAILWSSGLAAGPLMHIDAIQSDRYPLIDIEATVTNPYPGYVKNPEENTFKLFAVDGKKEQPVPIREVKKLPNEAQSVNLVMVIDSTKSVSKKSFKKIRSDAAYLSNRMSDRDNIAIYKINGKPELISEFARKNDQLKATIKELKRQGEITRIYDAIFSAIETAQSVESSSDAGKEQSTHRSVVVVFTDGRDEGSFITEDDVAKLSELGKKYRIPVYTILYDSSKNTRSFRRLALLTGAELIKTPSHKELRGLVDDARTFRDVPFLIRFNHTEIPDAGRKTTLKLTWKSKKSEDHDRIEYTAPWHSLFGKLLSKKMLVFVIIGAGILFVAASLLLAVRLYLRKRREQIIQQLDTGKGPDLDHPLAYDYRQKKSDSEETRPGVFDLTELLNKPPEKPAAEEPPVSAKKQSIAAAPEKRQPVEEETLLETIESVEPPDRTLIEEKNVVDAIALETLIEKERLRLDPLSKRRLLLDENKAIFLKDYAYNLLQTALRGAIPYKSGTLLIGDPDRNPREYDLFLETTVIGTGRFAHIHLKDKTVSPVHARIKRVDGKYVLYDMMSESGMFLNGKKLLRPKPLRNGDIIKMGHSTLRFKGVR